LHPQDFPTDPEDGIASVQVNDLRLDAVDSASERVTLECKRDPPYTIWQMANDRFGFSNPLLGGWQVSRAKFTITFHPEPDLCRGRRLPLTVRVPHACDLKDRTERERMIGEKYLQRWCLVKDV
jgi:hypothetical protein